MFWIRSCKTLLGEADTAKKFQSNMLAEMMLALTDLCEHFCSTWPSVVVGVCVCVCVHHLCVSVYTDLLKFCFFFSFFSTDNTNPNLMFSHTYSHDRLVHAGFK